MSVPSASGRTRTNGRHRTSCNSACWPMPSLRRCRCRWYQAMAGWRPLAPTSSSDVDGSERMVLRTNQEGRPEVPVRRGVMRQCWKLALLVGATLGSALVPAAAVAQRVCPDGRTASGQCVNAGLAESMRQAGVIYSQPNLSTTAYPVLPVLDFIFRYPHQLNPDSSKPSATGSPVR